jgi:hypothetical protein
VPTIIFVLAGIVVLGLLQLRYLQTLTAIA